jgi:hypothetical protein
VIYLFIMIFHTTFGHRIKRINNRRKAQPLKKWKPKFKSPKSVLKY